MSADEDEPADEVLDRLLQAIEDVVDFQNIFNAPVSPDPDGTGDCDQNRTGERRISEPPEHSPVQPPEQPKKRSKIEVTTKPTSALGKSISPKTLVQKKLNFTFVPKSASKQDEIPTKDQSDVGKAGDVVPKTASKQAKAPTRDQMNAGEGYSGHQSDVSDAELEEDDACQPTSKKN